MKILAIFTRRTSALTRIVTSAKAGGLKQLILTAKHHDGLCLWPSPLHRTYDRQESYKDAKVTSSGRSPQPDARHGLKFASMSHHGIAITPNTASGLCACLSRHYASF